MSNIMERKSFEKETSRRFILDEVTPPIKYWGYEIYPAGYISFPCYKCYKKIRKINKIISIFLKRRREINNDDKVYKCKSLWKKHNDYPLAPERLKINGVDKLISSFLPKKKYVVHYRNLQQYLEMGLVLKKVHRGIQFYQSTWMKPYIKKNIKLRKEAKNDFEKDFFKLMNNAVFGKTIENIRKRQNVELVDNRKKALKFSTKPNFDRVTIFDEHLIAVHMKKTEVYFNKPIFVGQAILDISKTHMFDFHYNFIKDKYGDKAELLMTDTDSLVYHIQTDDFYKDINEDVKEWFDTSNYPKNHLSGIKTGVNKKENGKMKDEAGGLTIVEFVALCAKLYALKIRQNKEAFKNIPKKKLPFKGKEEERKNKGVKKSVIKKTLSFEDYLKCLFSEKKTNETDEYLQKQKS